VHRDHECDVHDGLRHLGPRGPDSTGPGQRRGRPVPDYRRVGGLTGSLIYPRLEQRLRRVTLVRSGLVIEGGTHLVLALTQSAAVAYVTMALFGVHAVVWGTVAVTVRQRATPDRLQGRVTSIYLLGSLGEAAVGSVTGGSHRPGIRPDRAILDRCGRGFDSHNRPLAAASRPRQRANMIRASRRRSVKWYRADG
jgi:hypothetical protein